MTLFGQGKYTDAEPLCKRSQMIREAALGPDHPHVAESLINRAELCREQVRRWPVSTAFLSLLSRRSVRHWGLGFLSSGSHNPWVAC